MIKPTGLHQVVKRQNICAKLNEILDISGGFQQILRVQQILSFGRTTKRRKFGHKTNTYNGARLTGGSSELLMNSQSMDFTQKFQRQNVCERKTSPGSINKQEAKPRDMVECCTTQFRILQDFAHPI